MDSYLPQVLDAMIDEDDDPSGNQWEARVTYKLGSPNDLKPGAVIKTKKGILRMFWLPQGGNYTDREKEDLAGFYDIPTISEVEEMVYGDSITPCEDYVEPDHPDSWLILLGIM